MSTAKYESVFCRIRISDPKLMTKAAKIAYQRNTAQGFDWEFAACYDCKIKWELESSVDIKTVSCSNCYGDNVYLVGLRLWFPKWSEKR